MIDADRIRAILAMDDAQIRELPVSEDLCNLIRCQFITQQQAGHRLLLACSMAGYAGVLTCDHPVCKPYCEAARQSLGSRPAYPAVSVFTAPPPAAREVVPGYGRSYLQPGHYISADPGGGWEKQDCLWIAECAQRQREASCPDVWWFWVAVVVLGTAFVIKLLSGTGSPARGEATALRR